MTDPLPPVARLIEELENTLVALRAAAGTVRGQYADIYKGLEFRIASVESTLAAARAMPAPDELREALKPFADRLGELEQEAHEALQVGGYVPLDDDNSVLIPVPWLRKARAVLEG